MTATYKLISTKGTRQVTGTQADAVRAAVAMCRELRPSYGVTIANADGKTVAEVDEDAEGEIVAVGEDADGADTQVQEVHLSLTRPRHRAMLDAVRDAVFARVSAVAPEADVYIRWRSDDGQAEVSVDGDSQCALVQAIRDDLVHAYSDAEAAAPRVHKRARKPGTQLTKCPTCAKPVPQEELSLGQDDAIRCKECDARFQAREPGALRALTAETKE